MTVSIVSLSGGNNTIPAPFFSLLRNGSVSINDGLTLTYTVDANGEISEAAPLTAGSESADWVPASAVQGAHFSSDTVNYATIILSGGAPGSLANIRAFSSTTNAGRITEWRVNGVSQELNGSGPNLTNDVRFAAVEFNAQGEITIQYRRAASSGGSAYGSALYIEPFTPGPSLTITSTTPITPGSTLTATASNFAAAPTTISLSDGASPALIPALTATASGDDYSLSAGIPDFPALSKAAFIAANPQWPEEAATEFPSVPGLLPGTITATVE